MTCRGVGCVWMQNALSTCPNLSKLVQTRPNSSKLVQTRPNSSKLVQTRPNSSKLVQTCPHLSTLVHTVTLMPVWNHICLQINYYKPYTIIGNICPKSFGIISLLIKILCGANLYTTYIHITVTFLNTKMLKYSYFH